MYAKMPDVVEELRRRDERDSARPVAPLKHYPDAIFLDTTGVSVDAGGADRSSAGGAKRRDVKTQGCQGVRRKPVPWR